MTNEQMRRRKSQPLNPPERDKKAKKEAKEKKYQKGRENQGPKEGENSQSKR
jgi:hypothetical protein